VLLMTATHTVTGQVESHRFPNSVRQSGTAFYTAQRFLVSKLCHTPASPMEALIYQPIADTYLLIRWPGQDYGPFKITYRKE